MLEILLDAHIPWERQALDLEVHWLEKPGAKVGS